jgi:hypothetical protein
MWRETISSSIFSPGQPAVVGRRLHNRLEGVDQLRPPAVVQRQGHDHAGVFRGLLFRPGHALLHRGPAARGAPDVAQPDVVLVHQRKVSFQVGPQQRHQEAGLGLRTLPVLRRKRIQRHGLQPDARGQRDHVAHRRNPLPVAGNARQMAAAGPAPVAVHDHCNVLR